MFERQNLFLAEIIDPVQLRETWRPVAFIIDQIVAAEHRCTARRLRQPQRPSQGWNIFVKFVEPGRIRGRQVKNSRVFALLGSDLLRYT